MQFKSDLLHGMKKVGKIWLYKFQGIFITCHRSKNDLIEGMINVLGSNPIT